MACFAVLRPRTVMPLKRRRMYEDDGLWSDFRLMDRVLNHDLERRGRDRTYTARPEERTLGHLMDRVWDDWTLDVGPTKRCQRIEAQSGKDKAVEKTKSKEDGFRLDLDATAFSPEEISVRVRGQKVMVEAEHREEGDGGQVYRRMVQELSLPPGTDPQTVQSKLSEDGILTVLALPQERTVPVLQDKDTSAEKEKPAKPSECVAEANGHSQKDKPDDISKKL